MYLGYQNDKIKFYTEHELPKKFYNIDKSEYTKDEYVLSDDCTEYIKKPDDWEEQQKKKERERIANLSLTRGDVFEALILAKGLGKTQIRAMIEKAQLDEVTKALYLNRFDEALNFYRSYPIFDMLGQALGITSSQLDKFFDTATVEETKAEAYKYLTSVTFVVNTVPMDATVIINETEGKSLSVPYGSDIEYSVSAEGYISQSGTVENLTEDKEVSVELEPEQVDTDSDTDSDLDTDNEQEIDK